MKTITTYKLASYTSEYNGKIVEVSMWNEQVNGSSAVIITSGEETVLLSINELRGLSSSINSLLYAVEH